MQQPGSSILTDGENRKQHQKYVSCLLSDAQQPFFPEIVENVTVSFGRKAVLKCEVENLRNYKVVDPFAK